MDTDRTEVQPGADNSTNFSVQDLAPKQHTIIIKLTGKRLRCTKDKYSFDYLNYTTTSPSSRSAAPTNGSSLTSTLLPSSEESSTSHKTILHSTTQHPTSSSSIMTTDMPFVSPPMAASSPGTLSPPSGYLAAIVIAAIATVVLFLLGVFLWIKRSMLKVLFGKIHVDELHGGQGKHLKNIIHNTSHIFLESRAPGSLRSYRTPTSQQRSLRSLSAPVPPRTREPRSAQSLSYLSTVPPGAVQNVRHKINALSDASYLFTAQPDPFRSFSNGPTYPMAPNSVDDSLT